MSADLLIKNGVVIPMVGQKIFNRGAIAIDGDKIVAVGPTTEVADEYEAKRVIDAGGAIVLPGLINTHTHLAMTLFRGVSDDLPVMKWLERIWSIESNLTPQDVYWGAMLGCLEMIRSGTTCFADHYFFMNQVAKAVGETGIRGVLAQAIFDKWGPRDIDTSLEGGLNFAKKFRDTANNRITCMLGPHGTFTCSSDTLKQVRQTANKEKLRIHMHMAESKEEVNKVKKQHGKTPVRFLADIGLLGPDLLGAHAIYVDEKEMSLLKRTDTKVNHNPTTNTKGATGTSPVPEMLKRKINVSLGTDGAGSNNTLDMLEEMKVTAILHKLRLWDPSVLSAWQVLEMATLNGAKAVGLEERIGSLEAGKKADIIIVKTDRPHLIPMHNVPSLLVYSANGNDVDTVIVDGMVIMDHRKILTVNEEEILRKAQEAFEGLLGRSGWKFNASKMPERQL
jgi:5-methylthioadenosine/S-adenosylhomocysteine deaminase